jgi:hypothetical protein
MKTSTKTALLALDRLRQDGLGAPFRNINIKSSVPCMYRYVHSLGVYIVVPFEQWAALCSGPEVCAIITYWEDVGTLLPRGVGTTAPVHIP